MSACKEKWTSHLMRGGLITLKRSLNPSTEVVGESVVLPTSEPFLMGKAKFVGLMFLVPHAG